MILFFIQSFGLHLEFGSRFHANIWPMNMLVWVAEPEGVMRSDDTGNASACASAQICRCSEGDLLTHS